jgi:hypothetical protein
VSEAWIVLAIVIVLGGLAIDRTRAYRALPVLLNRVRGRSRSAGRSQVLGVDSAEFPPVRIKGSDFTGIEEERRHGEGR